MDESIVPALTALSESPDRGDPVLDEGLARAKLSAYTQQNRRDQTVQILKAFIDHLPPGGKHVIVRFIATRDRLYELAEHLRMAVLIPMKAHGGKTPPVTPSPLGAFTGDDVAAEVADACSGDDLKSLRAICSKRDNYQCVVTKVWDHSARDKYNLGRHHMIGPTQLAHIIPSGLGHSENEQKGRYIAQCWETLYVLFPDLQRVLKPGTVNMPANAMTMVTLMHEDFGKMEMALIPTSVENEYTVKCYEYCSTCLPIPDRIVLTQHDKTVGMPSRVLIETHAAIAEILHASGQAEQIDELLDEYEAIRYLAADGSTDLQRLLSLALVP